MNCPLCGERAPLIVSYKGENMCVPCRSLQRIRESPAAEIDVSLEDTASEVVQ